MFQRQQHIIYAEAEEIKNEIFPTTRAHLHRKLDEHIRNICSKIRKRAEQFEKLTHDHMQKLTSNDYTKGKNSKPVVKTEAGTKQHAAQAAVLAAVEGWDGYWAVLARRLPKDAKDAFEVESLVKEEEGESEG